VTFRCVYAILLLLGVGAAGSCSSDPTLGYSTMSSFSKEVRTISIPVFANDSSFRDVEFELTEALIKQIQTHTPYQVTNSTYAESILHGRITGVELNELSKSPLTGLGEEVLLRITIAFTWQNLATDTPIVERKSFSGSGLFVPSTPSSERIDRARTSAVEDLAHAIVDEMRSAW